MCFYLASDSQSRPAAVSENHCDGYHTGGQESVGWASPLQRSARELDREISSRTPATRSTRRSIARRAPLDPSTGKKSRDQQTGRPAGAASIAEAFRVVYRICSHVNRVYRVYWYIVPGESFMQRPDERCTRRLVEKVGVKGKP